MNLPFKDVDIESNENPKENIETLERRVSVKKTCLTCLTLLIIIIVIIVIVVTVIM